LLRRGREFDGDSGSDRGFFNSSSDNPERASADADYRTDFHSQSDADRQLQRYGDCDAHKIADADRLAYGDAKSGVVDDGAEFGSDRRPDFF